jgi:hypothetical protein
LKPSRLLRAFRRRVFAHARKLKPIGIGIAALLAISLSYVGVKALTKSPVKAPPIVAQPSPAAPQQIPTTSETAVPQIAKAMETAAPALTNPANEPNAAQSAAPPNQSPETAALTLTNPATAPGATQNVAPQNQDATGNAAAAQNVAPQNQDVAEQSTLHTQPAQPPIAAKQPENPSNASRTRSSDASTRSASSGQTAAKSSGAGHSTSRSSASANAPPPASARAAPRAPAPPKATGESRQRRRSEFEGSAPGEDAIGNAGAAQKQDAAEQSTSRTQPGQPQIAAKPEPESPSNASRGTRSGDASPPEPLQQEAVPQFPWPPPKASASATISRELLLEDKEHPQLGDAVAALDLAFRKAGYGERSYYSVPGGFAMASRIEQMNHDGTPKGAADRWSLEVPPMRKFSLSAYMSALFTARSGYYRVIVFVVTSHPFRQASAKVTSEQAGFWSSRGLNELPEYFAKRDYTSAHKCTALIYEFKRTEGRHAEFVDPSEITGQIHLEKSGLLAALKK